MVRGTQISTRPTMAGAPTAFLIVLAVIMIALILVLSLIWVIKFQSEDDKNDSYLCKALVVRLSLGNSISLRYFLMALDISTFFSDMWDVARADPNSAVAL